MAIQVRRTVVSAAFHPENKFFRSCFAMAIRSTQRLNPAQESAAEQRRKRWKRFGRARPNASRALDLFKGVLRARPRPADKPSGASWILAVEREGMTALRPAKPRARPLPGSHGLCPPRGHVEGLRAWLNVMRFFSDMRPSRAMPRRVGRL